MPRPPLPTVGADSSGVWGTKNNALWTDAHTSLDRLDSAVFNVSRYGAVGDGVTNDSAAIQAAINDIPATGGIVAFEAKNYFIGTGITTTKSGLRIQGAVSTGQNSLVGSGGTRLIVGSGVTAITFGDGLSAWFNGPDIRDLVLIGTTTAVGGLKFLRTNNFRVSNVIAYDFLATGAIGFSVLGSGGTSQYGTMTDCSANDCMTGLYTNNANGLRLIGGHFDGNRNGSGTPASAPRGIGSKGIHVTGGDTFRLFGTIVQFYDTGVHVESGNSHELHGGRIEASTTNLRIGANSTKVYGGTMNNFIIGGGGTGVQVDAGALYTVLHMDEPEAFATKILDNGTDTLYQWQGKIFLPTVNGVLTWNGGETGLQRSGFQTIKATHHFWVAGIAQLSGALQHQGTTAGFYNTTPIVKPAANPDTTGASLANLEIEVNQIKAMLRSLGLMTA